MASVFETATAAGDEAHDVERLREENRRMAVTLGAFSAFIASRGLLEDAWQFVLKVHEMNEDTME